MIASTAIAGHPAKSLAGIVLLGVLLALLTAHVAGAAVDFVAVLRYPFEIDYGEGIVWQQAVLIPGPRMYGTSQDLPFIVFHYPPLYYLAVRAMRWLQPDYLAAGRLVSGLSTALVAPMVAGLALSATSRPGRLDAAIAVAAGMFALCLHPVHIWGMLMRVDMLAVALGLAGLLTAVCSNWRGWGIAAALLLCEAAVFTKHTELSAGIAVFLIGLLRNPRGTVVAATAVAAAGLGGLGLLQHATAGGFLENIVGYNINRFSLSSGYEQFRVEQGNLPYALGMVLAIPVLLKSVVPSALRRQPARVMEEIKALRNANTPTTCRALLVLHFGLATLMLASIFKSGSSINYLIEWLITGCVLIAILLMRLARSDVPNGWVFPGALLLLALMVCKDPLRETKDPTATDLKWQGTLVQRISAAQKPAASEDMTLLMRAGKQVIFEPAIVTELAAVGRWNEAPLLAMIRDRRFAFMITTDDKIGGSPRRSPAVDAAMRQAYPRVESVGLTLWMHLPSKN